MDHVTENILKATELYPLKGAIVLYVNYRNNFFQKGE